MTTNPPVYEIFNKLNSAYNVVYEYELFTTPVFEYWNLTDILSTVENVNPNTFKNSYTLNCVFRESIPARLRIKKPEKIIQLTNENIHIINAEKKFDAEMSRYACWALMKQIGDSAIFQQEYFLHPNCTFETVIDNARQTQRIVLRNFLAKYEKQLSGILGKFNKDHQYNAANYSGLRREIISGLFDGKCAYEIKLIHRLPETKPLTDYMNNYLLSIYGNLLKNIVNTWDNLPGIKTYTNLREIAQKMTINTRKQFARGNPINNFEMASINEVIKQRSIREYEFAKQYMNTKNH